MKKFKILTPCIAVLIILSLLIGACTQPSDTTPAPGTQIPAQPAAQKTPVNFKYATQNVATAPPSVRDVWFFEELKKRITEREVKVDYHWAGALGKPQEILELMRTGAVDIGQANTTYFPSVFPLGQDATIGILGMGEWEKNALLLDMLWTESQLMQNEVTSANLKMLLNGAAMPFGLSARKPLKSVADLKGTKIRMLSAGLTPLYDQVGLVPVSILFAEAYEGLMRGTIDTSWGDYVYTQVQSWYDPAKFFLELDLPVPMANTEMNLQSYTKLPDDVKKVIDELVIDSRAWSLAWLKEEETKSRKFLVDKGVTFYRLSPEELSTWKNAAKPKVIQYTVDLAKQYGVAEGRMQEVWALADDIVQRLAK
ncbi:MAG: TRAP transporter substrate-binding protein DctP [Chloroflexi bacterium]|nr:TRAP transporter substrate-binding protein DctP [Chloroflexota bacterium]